MGTRSTHKKHDAENNLELTDEASLGRLHPGREVKQVHHKKNLVHCYCEAHPLSPGAACPELPGEWQEDEKFGKARWMLYPLPQIRVS